MHPALTKSSIFLAVVLIGSPADASVIQCQSEKGGGSPWSWREIDGVGHSDHHAIWINPRDNDHILLGNDGGLDVSYDQGENWEAISTMALGQFYAISADMRKPYHVCGGLQDNGSWCGPSGTRTANLGILNSDWFRVGGGDGFYTAQDPTDWTVLFSESQDGATNRVDLRTGRSQSIRPRGPQAGRGAARIEPGRSAALGSSTTRG